jgi:hypothetical protein
VDDEMGGMFFHSLLFYITNYYLPVIYAMTAENGQMKVEVNDDTQPQQGLETRQSRAPDTYVFFFIFILLYLTTSNVDDNVDDNDDNVDDYDRGRLR